MKTYKFSIHSYILYIFSKAQVVPSKYAAGNETGLPPPQPDPSKSIYL